MFEKKRKRIKNKVQKSNFRIGSVQGVFYGLRFRSNRFKHSVKRFGRSGLTTLVNTKRICSVRSLTFETYPAKNNKNKEKTKKEQNLKM